MHSPFNTQMMRVRSYESEVFIAFTHPRLSLATGPTGAILAEDTSTERFWTVTEVDLSEVDRVRAGAATHLRDRRSELDER